jgi:hypothetical protein
MWQGKGYELMMSGKNIHLYDENISLDLSLIANHCKYVQISLLFYFVHTWILEGENQG